MKFPKIKGRLGRSKPYHSQPDSEVQAALKGFLKETCPFVQSPAGIKIQNCAERLNKVHHNVHRIPRQILKHNVLLGSEDAIHNVSSPRDLTPKLPKDNHNNVSLTLRDCSEAKSLDKSTDTGKTEMLPVDKTPRPLSDINIIEEESILSGNVSEPSSSHTHTAQRNHNVPQNLKSKTGDWFSQLQDIKLVLEEGRKLFMEMQKEGNVTPQIPKIFTTPTSSRQEKCSKVTPLSQNSTPRRHPQADTLRHKLLKRQPSKLSLFFTETPSVSPSVIDEDNKENQSPSIIHKRCKQEEEDSVECGADFGKVPGSACGWTEEWRKKRLLSQEVLESTLIPETTALEAKDLLPPVSPMETLHTPMVPTPARSRETTFLTPAKETYSTPEEGTSGRSTLMDTSSSVADKEAPKRTSRGQVNLSVYINSGLLTVHVLEARNLRCKTGPHCGTFITVSVEPDGSSRPQCQTDTIPDSTQPFYDEKFSFELMEGDEKRRVLLSMWQTDGSTGLAASMRLLGCMSFGLHNIDRDTKIVNGWYHLLPDHLGKHKHLSVRKASAASQAKMNAPSPKVKDVPTTFRCYQMFLNRGCQGYGFTMTGSCPAMVCRVEPRGPADQAGMRPGDFITRVNRENVSTASSDAVARIIRHCRRRVLLEVHRPIRDSDLISEPSPWKPQIHYNDESSDSSSSEDEGEDSSLRGGSWDSWSNQCPVIGHSRRKVTFKDF